MAALLTGQTWSDPAWKFFFAGRRRNDRPDRVLPGLAIQKNAAYMSISQWLRGPTYRVRVFTTVRCRLANNYAYRLTIYHTNLTVVSF